MSSSTPEPDVAGLIDLEKYPIFEPDSKLYHDVIEKCRRELKESGSVAFPGFIRSDVITNMAKEVSELPAFHRLDFPCVYGERDDWYTEANLARVEETHPARRRFAQDTFAVAADLIPSKSLVNRVYNSPAVTRFIADALNLPELYHFGDDFQKLNVMYTRNGGGRVWHYDYSDAVITLMLQNCEEGGEFEFAPFTRGEKPAAPEKATDSTEGIKASSAESEADAEWDKVVKLENFDTVSACFEGQYPGVRKTKATDGTLHLFNGKKRLQTQLRVYVIGIIYFSAQTCHCLTLLRRGIHVFVHILFLCLVL